jgi:maleate isomerase
MKRVGLIIPSSNRMVEQEMVRHFPDGVEAHVTRLRMTGDHRMSQEELLPHVREASGALADAKCDVIAFHCTANSMEGGPEGEVHILDALRDGGAKQATTTASAIRRALAALNAKRIALITPYSQATTDHEAAFLAEIGHPTVSAKGHNLPGSDAYCAAPPQFWRDKTLEARNADADCYFISCANTSAFSVIDELENELDRPVITSNQSVVWDTLTRIGWRDMDGCPGRLFRTN